MKIVNVETQQPAMYPGVNACVMAVLTQDARGLFAVYVGLVPQVLPVAAGKEWIARSGSKLSYEASKQYFRGINPEEYRA